MSPRTERLLAQNKNQGHFKKFGDNYQNMANFNNMQPISGFNDYGMQDMDMDMGMGLDKKTTS